MDYHTHYVLRPRQGDEYLPMRQTINLIRSAFPQGTIDPEKGRRDTEARLGALTRLGAPQEILESYRYPGVYCYLHDGNHDLRIECMVWPLQSIGVSFATEEHERATTHLLRRLAESLGYEAVPDVDR